MLNFTHYVVFVMQSCFPQAQQDLMIMGLNPKFTLIMIMLLICVLAMPLSPQGTQGTQAAQLSKVQYSLCRVFSPRHARIQ